MLCFAVSCSKSHTVYGLRTGALVCLHVDEKFLNNVSDVLLHSGRGTWSAAPRVAQRAIAEIHNDPQLLEKWTEERDAFKQLLTARREALQSFAITNRLTINPTHDGYFAFLECEENHAICEMAAKDHQVYLVPLNGGIRIGVCAIPEEKMERVAVALADGLARTR
jgi:aromatic-amino-acid transaminase